jgi:small-conductance mechanosensitive channel
MKPSLTLLLAWLLGAACAVSPGFADAKDKPEKKDAAPIEVPEKLTPEEADALLGRLTDAQARQLLSRQLHKQAEAQAHATEPRDEGGIAMMIVHLREGLERSSDLSERRATVIAEGWRQLPGAVAASVAQMTEGGGLAELLVQLAVFAAIAALGVLASRAAHRAVRPHMGTVPQASADFSARAAAAFLRTTIELLPFLVFAIVVVVTVEILFHAGSPQRAVQITFTVGALLVYAVVIASRFLFAPGEAGRRVLAIEDPTAAYLYRWIVRIGAVWIVALIFAGLLVANGVKDEARLLVRLAGGALICLMLIGMVFEARAGIAGRILQGGGWPPGGWRAALAASWHWLAIAYVLLVWLLWAAGVVDHGEPNLPAALASLGAVLVFPLFDRWIGNGIDDLFSSGTGEALVQRPEYASVLHRVMRVLLFLMLFAGVSELWGFELLGEMGITARRAVLGASFDLLAALAIAALGWHFVKIGIDRRLRGQMVDGVLVPAPARLLTLLPLARKFIMVVLAIMTLMLILSGLGVNIGPLLAGAGVLGLAIGFGAQTLVKDILTGVFFLMDDAFRIGEYIQSGNYKGTVEDFGLRSVKLRHHRGPVFTVPFGELKAIQNMSRDWVIDKFNIGITYDSDIDKAKKLIKQVGKTLAEDAELGPKFIEPLKMQGVEKFGDFAVQIRVKMKTMPNEQFVIRRKAYSMIKKAFDANGVKFAYPTVQVAGGTDDTLAAVARQGLQLSKPAAPDA